MRRSGTAAALAIATLALAAGCGDGRSLDGDEIGTLLADKVVEGRHAKKGFRFRRFYRSHGVFFSIRSMGEREQRLEGRWRITDGDLVCLRWLPAPVELCRNIVVDHSGAYRKVLIKSNGKHVTVVEYERFVPGSAEDLGLGGRSP